MRRRSRGAAVATAVLVAFLVLLFGLALASLASFQMHASTSETDRRQALEAAQAGLALATDALARDPKYGTHSERIDQDVGAAHVVVSFDGGGVDAWSRNNLQGASGVPGWSGMPVPPYSALLIASGTSPKGETSIVAAVVQLEPFNYALAASGSVSGASAVTVNGAASLLAFQQGGLDVDGDIYGGSVSLGAGSSVTGKIKSAGTVSVASGTPVLGGIEENQSPQSLPDIAISTYDNSTMSGVVQMAPGSYLLTMPVTGPTCVNGNLVLQQGALLVNGYLFVNGDLTIVNGSLTGTGSVFVTGKTEVHNSLTLSGATTIALFSQGQLDLTGAGFYQGLLYSRTGIHALADLQVLGGAYVNGGDVVADTHLTVTYIPQYLSVSRSWITKSGERADVKQVYWKVLQ